MLVLYGIPSSIAKLNPTIKLGVCREEGEQRKREVIREEKRREEGGKQKEVDV